MGHFISWFLKISFFIGCFSHESDFSIVSGPGLQPNKIILPARYIILNITSISQHIWDESLKKDISWTVEGCRVWADRPIDRKDNTYLLRYRLYDTCENITISIFFKGKHVGESPYHIKGPIQPEGCWCEEDRLDLDSFLSQWECGPAPAQLLRDVERAGGAGAGASIDVAAAWRRLRARLSPQSASYCLYSLRSDTLYRSCQGQHTGFKTFHDSIMLSLMSKIRLPESEWVMNLGDWPLSEAGVWSWCGREDAADLVLPTYDLTESSLHAMGRVSLDMLAVQGAAPPWHERAPLAFWRGRDSNRRRLELIKIARQHPTLFNASLTNFFFFRDQEEEYGPKVPHVSFFEFLKYKYSVVVDGTVAAYRTPYLLGGGALVLKQRSPYREHFYPLLQEYHHYVPVAEDLSDLPDQVRWAQRHDEEARRIAENAQRFANQHLLPHHIYCYYAHLFKEWSKSVQKSGSLDEEMEKVTAEDGDPRGIRCRCQADFGTTTPRPDL